jgi:hypothetical protein
MQPMEQAARADADGLKKAIDDASCLIFVYSICLSSSFRFAAASGPVGRLVLPKPPETADSDN